MIAIAALLLMAGKGVPAPRTTTPVFFEIDAGGDGLRSDSIAFADVVFDNGARLQVPFTDGIADNQTGSEQLPRFWPGAESHISSVSVTLTGVRGGLESADDFDIRNVRLVSRPVDGQPTVLWERDDINFRLHGVGTWTTGILIPPHVILPRGRIQEVFVDLYFGDTNVNNSFFLGLFARGRWTFRPPTAVVHASALSHAQVKFIYPLPLDMTAVRGIQLQELPEGLSDVVINGASVFLKSPPPLGDTNPAPIETELTHDYNVNFDVIDTGLVFGTGFHFFAPFGH
ncbi:MAG TPA: hypothetical protein VG820_11260 [Fimbriimonadaceae bacterium]|nr:hypothetical protein [Fimbriimonadaceae bacterium]